MSMIRLIVFFIGIPALSIVVGLIFNRDQPYFSVIAFLVGIAWGTFMRPFNSTWWW